MQRRLVLLCATAAGDEARRFGEAAEPLGVELVLATPGPSLPGGVWPGDTIAVPSGGTAASCSAVLVALGRRLDGLLALDDRAAVLAAMVAERCGLPWHDLADAQVGNDGGLLHDRGLGAGTSEGGVALTFAGVLDHGWLQVLALLGADASRGAPADVHRLQVIAAVARAARAAGLWHGPVSAECRVGEGGVVVRGVAARPAEGPCARALRFEDASGRQAGLEALLLRAAVGESLRAWRLQDDAAVGR